MTDWKDWKKNKTLIKSFGGLYPCSNIDGIVLGQTEVNLTENKKTKEDNSKINFLIERKSSKDKFFDVSLIKNFL